MYWNGIRSFIAVAEYGSFTAAAEATGLSKASLSQQVSELEAKLGVQLLYRTTRKLRLTELGRGYLEQCLQGIRQLEDAESWVTQETDTLNGSISMNAVGGIIGEEIIAPLLIRFRELHPEISIRLDFSSQREDLLENKYDLVMRMGALPDSTLIARHLHTITTRYVASPGFLATNPVNTPEDLNRMPLIYGSVNQWLLESGQQRVQVQARSGFQIANGRVMYQAAVAGQGIARLADIYVNRAIEKGLLKDVLPDWHQKTPISLVCPPGRYQLQRVRLLMDWLIAEFPVLYQHQS